jgi:hypothetical protein
MPCQSDYLAASGQEMESKRVCECICYLYKKLSKDVPKWIIDAADNYYGNIHRLDEATKTLCECCRSLLEEEKEKYIYDAHNEDARKLASWWERHQEWDNRRVKEEEETRRNVVLKERALKKLTIDEMKALGLLKE